MASGALASDRSLVQITSADADHALHFSHKNLAVTNFSGASGVDDRIHAAIRQRSER